MPDINVRNYVIDALKPLLPKKWNVKPYNAIPDAIDVTSIVLVFQSYARNPAAPRGPRIANFILTIITPKSDPGAADDALDDDVIDLLNAIDNINVGRPVSDRIGLTWTTAERGVAYGRAGFDITLSMPIQLETETP